MISYLALGDSYTIGEAVAVEDRWPVRLASLLHSRGTDVGEPKIIATTGWTTAELQEGIRSAGALESYDLVSLLIGVNNQYRGQSIEVYRSEFKALLKQAVGFARGRADRVFVVSIPDWGVTPFAADRDRAKIGQEIDAFNKVGHEEASALGVAFIDITPVSREAIQDESLNASDGLHPSGKMYKKWVELILPVVEKLLKS